MFINTSFSQVTTNPACFSDGDAVTIRYDATLGTTGLVGATKVYVHAGVIIDSPTSTNWQHVVGNWGQDDGVGLMTKVAGTTDIWEISFTPRTYFNVPTSEVIYRLGLVFRNADGTKEGKTDANGDFFIDLAQDAINLQVTSTNPLLVNNLDVVPIQATTCSNATFSLYIDNVLEFTVAGTNTFSYNYNITQAAGSLVLVKLVADVGAASNTKEFSYTVRTPTVSQVRPAGVVSGINYSTDPTKVTLSLLAPFKTSVYVLGDFNNWTVDPAYQMMKDGEYFWLEVSGLVSGKEYVFQYLVDESIRVADPYTDKVSDPWDDKYIDALTYPGLIQYPEGKTTNRASVLQTAQQPYNWINSSFTSVPKEELVIYELLIRDFDARHSYKAVMDKLDYLASLGINAIEFMPTNEFEGNSSWGYNPNFYFAPDKYYGTKNDFKALIDACHSRGIAVFIDVVLNHSYNSSPMARMYWNTSTNRPAADNPWYNETSNFENTDAHWGVDFNHESTYTKNFIDSVNTYWIKEYKVDGFRFDFTKGFSNNFKSNSTDSWGSLYDANRIANLKRMADVIWASNPNAYVIFEHLSDNSEETVLANYGILLWGNMNHDYSEISMGYANGKTINWGYYQSRGWAYNNVITYMESHDEERQMYKNITYGNSSGTYDVKNHTIALQRLKVAAGFFFTVPGPKMIWQFGEFGYDVSINEGGRISEKPTKWEYLDDIARSNVLETYKELIGLRSKYEVFTKGTFTWQPDGNFKSIHISNADTSVVIIGNFDVLPTEMNPNFQHTGIWYDFFTGNELSIEDVNTPIALGPGGFHIYTDKRLHAPKKDIITSLVEPQKGAGIQLYPNPVNTILNVNLNSSVSNTWVIRDVFGKEVVKGNGFKNRISIDVSYLPIGIYTFISSSSVLNFIKN